METYASRLMGRDGHAAGHVARELWRGALSYENARRGYGGQRKRRRERSHERRRRFRACGARAVYQPAANMRAGAGAGRSAGADAGGGGRQNAVLGAGAGGVLGMSGRSAGGSVPSAGQAGAGCSAPLPGSKGSNPLFTDQYSADPAPFVDNCTFYIACGHDEGQTGFVMKEWFLLASTDMVHWTKRVTMRLTDFKWADANAWAGQIVTKNGKYFWFVPVNERG